MLTARKASFWRSRYEVLADGRVAAVWDGAFWRSGGRFSLDGRDYEVRGNVWGTRFTLTDATDGSGADVALATAERVGRRRWTVEAGGRTYRFRRASMWRDVQELYDDSGAVGTVRRVSMWRGDVAADLPGLPPAVRMFVLGVVITMWEAQAASGA
ncbi:hypothetical protein GCM10010124_34960 [Pilimelia terevasa]|uniref:Uncharacterized protein n=1 Tax=Pilimelia terevasa TaxID=53372 RepID=A0A8J3FJQ3_9ACTN|nr:hypothetical protein [Pilimelia terevasa]GGK39141.1 hypothetical protein GCM10010124_34960 [Pilimelia terevasa]